MAKEYPPTSEIIKDIEVRHQKIGEQINIIKELFNKD